MTEYLVLGSTCLSRTPNGKRKVPMTLSFVCLQVCIVIGKIGIELMPHHMSAM